MAETQPNPGGRFALNPAAFHILLALADEDRHGYAIMQAVASLTGGAMRLGPGTLYTNIKRLAGEGLIEETDDRPDPEEDDERRRYYRLTDSGRKILRAEVERMAGLVETARRLHLLPGSA